MAETPQRKLENRTALITGGARGIGQAIANVLAEEGAKIILADLLAPQGQEAQAAINKRHGQGTARFQQLDVTDEAAWQNFAAELNKDPSGVDILINNAGIYDAALVEEASLEMWRRIFAVNVEGVFLACKHIIPILKKRADRWRGGAAIVNISSMAGLIGVRALSAYCASKGAVRLFTKAVAMEYAAGEPLIRVNSVHPAVIDTMMGEQVAQTVQTVGLADNPEGARMAIEFNHPMGRLGTPEEVARAVLFLASDDSAFTTGSELLVDGGVLAQ